MRRIPQRDLDEVLEDTRDVWRHLDGASVLLTGVTGFVGTWLLDALAHAREQTGCRINAILSVRSAARFRERFPHLAGAQWITLVVGDIRDLDLATQPVDFAMHSASAVPPHVLAADPFGTQDVVIRGTQRVFEAAAERGATRALLVSSGSVYGRNTTPGIPLREDTGMFADPFQPGRLLAESKRVAETVSAAVASRTGLEVIVARGFAMSGPWLPLSSAFALGNFVHDALEGREIQVTGDGSPVRSYLYAGDVATWLWTLLVRGRPGEPVNVGSEESIRIDDLASLVASRSGGHVKEALARATVRTTDFFVPDTTRARALGLRARVPVATAIDRMLHWHRA